MPQKLIVNFPYNKQYSPTISLKFYPHFQILAHSKALSVIFSSALIIHQNKKKGTNVFASD